MRRRTKRRPRVAWFPTFGGTRITEAESAPFPGIEQEFDIDDTKPNGDVFWDAVALTFDTSESAVQAQSDPDAKTLRDLIQGNEYRLRRIVGKIFIHVLPFAKGESADTLIDAAFGFIVCKTYDDGIPLTDFSEVNPLSQESMEDPWIWRRRWILNPAGPIINNIPTTGDLSNSLGYSDYPASNMRYGSVLDGPHIDAKSNRRVHRSERLFAVLAARNLNPQTEPWNSNFRPTKLRALLDYRLLGSLGSQQYGNRGNMAR